jgi:hypothetical protein
MTAQHIRTLEDGSVDYGYYKQSGRRMRNDAVHALFAGIGDVIGSLAARIIAGATPKRNHIEAGLAAKTAAIARR